MECAVVYKDVILPRKFYLDFMAYDQLIVEIKSRNGIIKAYCTQLV
ncbi:GxxExxY protein [Pedobacter sandarakinus]